MWVLIIVIIIAVAVYGVYKYKLFDTDKFTIKEKQLLAKSGQLDSATELYEKASNGDVDAMVLLSFVYEGDLNNSEKAFYWLEKAAAQGNAHAEFFLSAYYDAGIVTQKNSKKAHNLIISSAQKGCAPAIDFCKNELKMSTAEMRNYNIPV